MKCRHIRCRREVEGTIGLCRVHERKFVRCLSKLYMAGMELMQEAVVARIPPKFFATPFRGHAPFHQRMDEMVADALPFWEKDLEWWTRQEAAEQRKTKKAA